MAEKKKAYEKPNVKKIQVERKSKLRESIAASCSGPSCGSCAACSSCACGACGCSCGCS